MAFAAGTFVVTNTNDSGTGSLRQAILDANANAGSDLINFNIASGPRVITPTSLLPDITDPLVIDGTSQPGFAGVPLIEVSGINVPAVPNAGLLTIKAGNTTVRGLIVNHCKNFGISIVTAGGNLIEGNYLGTDATGNLATNNQGNLISINDSSNNVIGGTTPGARNVISGAGFDGISIFGGNARGNVIQGNYIGTNAAGTAALGNASSGIFLGSSSNFVGGANAGARNLVSGNGVHGIFIHTTDPSGNVILGNYIGTDVTGNVGLGNSSFGISIGDSDNNTIGGPSVGGGNVISSNHFGGILLSGSNNGSNGNIIQNNYIGTGADGKTPLGNQSDGLSLSRGSNNTVGGSSPGTGNTIAFNGRGISVFAGTGNFIFGNSIFSNNSFSIFGSRDVAAGIDLNSDGLTPNDSGDSDSGPNNLQNFPVISSVVAGTSQTTITGSLNSLPNTTFRIHFYANSACGNGGNGEGATAFGSGATLVTTNSIGDALFTVVIPGNLPAGKAITATATDPAGNTSEFSACDGNRTAGRVAFTTPVIQVMEDIGVVRIEIVRFGGTRGSLSVKYSTADITATAGQDYVASSGTITFDDGGSLQTIDIPISDDAIVENDETFVVRLSDAANIDSLGSPNQVFITLQDDSVPPVLTIENGSRSEGNTGTVNSQFRVSYYPPSGRTATVDYSTRGLTATSGVDFQPVSGTLTFGPQTDTNVIVVPIIGDQLDEFDETFNVVLSNPVGATIDGGPAVGTILDDDPAPLVSITDVSVPEGNAGGLTSAQFVLTLSAPSAKSPCVQASTSDGTATAGSDYVPFGPSLMNPAAFIFFNAGATSATVTVNVIPDYDIEPNETFFVNLVPCLNDVANISVLRPRATGTILNDDPSSTIQFSDSIFFVNEGTPDAVVSVNRTGDLSGAATVNYATSDASAANRCVFATTSASERCDYLTTTGTLHFAPGEMSKVISIPIIDDSYLEGDETFTISLINPTVAGIGNQPLASIRIVDNESANGPNPIEQASFFVRQHYLDFLNREPDQGGWDFWINQITSCGSNVQCTEARRVDVSASFFLSIEFQQSGYLVERFYKVAYGDATGTSTLGSNHQLSTPTVRFKEFLQDMQRIGQGVVVLQPGWQQALENNKQAYALEFVQTSRFISAFPGTMTPTEFVDRLNQNAGNVLSANDRTTAINLFGGAANTGNVTARAQAVRQVAEDIDLYNTEYNRAFVLAEYFGYLRRNPNDAPESTLDYTGFDFWLTKLNQFNGNYLNAEMVKAFLSSIEYRQRFGP